MLTNGQLKILVLIAQGKTYKEIAEIEHISWHTVKNRMRYAKKKTNTKSIAQCLVWAFNNHFLEIKKDIVCINKGAE